MTARAQLNTPPEAPLPTTPAPTPPPYTSRVVTFPPSPTFTQDRVFTSTRFWLLDPGNFEFQVWYRSRYYDNDPSVPHDTSEHLFQAEVEWGIAHHLQLDLYANFQYVFDDGDGRHTFQYEGTQVELRIAIPDHYGQIWGNPVIYLEWHPRHNQPDRGEIRLLLGGMATRWLLLAANPYVEANLEPTDSTSATGAVTHPYIADAEVGTTLAAGFAVTSWLNLSAQAKIGVDMLGDTKNQFHFVAWAGPGFILKPLRNQHLKLMGTVLFRVAGPSVSYSSIDEEYGAAQWIEPLFIVGSQW